MSKILPSLLAALLLLLALMQPAFAQTLNTPESQSIAAPYGVTSIQVTLGVTGGSGDSVGCTLANGNAVAPNSPCSLPCGPNEITCTSADSYGIKTATFIVTVQCPPTLVCPTSAIVSQCTGAGAADVAFTSLSATAYNGVSLTSAIACTPSSDSSFAIGTNNVACTVSDSCGAVNTCNFQVVVQDTAAPIISCPNMSPGSCGASPASFSATATDTCWSNVAVVCSPSSYSGSTCGSTPVTCTATDKSGNTNSCSFNYEVTAAAPPTINVPADITTTIACAETASVAISVTASDPCGTPTLSCSMGSTNIPASGSYSFPIGTSTISCTATNCAQLTSTKSFTVTVVSQLPAMTCPSNIQLNAGLGGKAAVQYSVSATSNYATGLNSEIACSCSAGAVTPGMMMSIGTTAVTCDVCGASCNFAVKIVNTPPVITCPAATTIQCTADEYTYSTYSVTATDAQDGNLDSSISCTEPSGAYYPLGQTPISCSVTDSGGLSASCQFSITVVDTTAPVLTCPSSSAFAAVQCQANGQTDLLIAPTVWDSCECDANLAVSCSPNVFQPTAFPLGTTTVSCTAADLSKNSASCSFPVTVIDTIPPVLSAQTGSITMCCDETLHNITATQCGIKAYDACDGHGIPLEVSSVSADESIALNTDVAVASGYLQLLAKADTNAGRQYAVKFTATDAHGNIAAGTCYVNMIAQQAALASGNTMPTVTNTAALSYNVAVSATLGV